MAEKSPTLWAVVCESYLMAPDLKVALRWANALNMRLANTESPDPQSIANVVAFDGTAEQHAENLAASYAHYWELTEGVRSSAAIDRPQADPIYWRGATHGHGTLSDGGHDYAGYTVGLGDCALYFGEVPDAPPPEDAKHLGAPSGTWIALYPPRAAPTVIGKAVDRASAMRALEAISRAIGTVPPVMRRDSMFPYPLVQAEFDALMEQLRGVLLFVNTLADRLECGMEHMDGRPDMPGFVEYIMSRVSPKA